MSQYRFFDREKDSAALYVLWRLVLGGRWRIERNPLVKLLTAREGAATRDVIVAVIGKQVVGFVCVEADPESREGNIVALGVLPLVQRRGVGTGLYNMAEQYFRQYGVQRVTLGRGNPRIWPGVPHAEHNAFPFFEAMGWQFDGTRYDVFLDLRGYQTPLPVKAQVEATGVAFVTANKNWMPALLDFHRSEFPQWVRDYRYVSELGDINDILIAITPRDEIVGSLIMYSQRSHPSRRDVIWQEEFGLDVTGLSAIGIAAHERERGIGRGLVARASELLKWQGAGFCVVGDIPETAFFEPLGYKMWYSYALSSKDL